MPYDVVGPYSVWDVEGSFVDHVGVAALLVIDDAFTPETIGGVVLPGGGGGEPPHVP